MWRAKSTNFAQPFKTKKSKNNPPPRPQKRGVTRRERSVRATPSRPKNKKNSPQNPSKKPPPARALRKKQHGQSTSPLIRRPRQSRAPSAFFDNLANSQRRSDGGPILRRFMVKRASDVVESRSKGVDSRSICARFCALLRAFFTPVPPPKTAQPPPTPPLATPTSSQTRANLFSAFYPPPSAGRRRNACDRNPSSLRRRNRACHVVTIEPPCSPLLEGSFLAGNLKEKMCTMMRACAPGYWLSPLRGWESTCVPLPGCCSLH